VGLGDELMVAGMARVAQQTDPRKVRVQYEKGKRRWCTLWDNNPRIAKHEEVGDFQILEPRERYLRAYCSRKTLEQWDWKPYRPPVGEIYFHSYELAFGKLNLDLIVLEPFVKRGASPNKQWGRDRWGKLANMLVSEGLKVATVGPQPAWHLGGARHVHTSIREAAALIARARAVVVPEGALHHIAAAVGTPAVVIYGGYISPEVTGYDGQIGLFTGGGLGCGMRVQCKHCQDAMAAITPEMVFEKLMSVLRD
jgi:ADP-heptose:LPS heptosyltransferase